MSIKTYLRAKLLFIQMKNFSLLILFVIGVSLASCTSEDQKVVKRLAEGEWEVTSVKVNGSAQPDSTFAGQKYTFEECRVANEDCGGTYTYNDPTKGPQTSSFTYSIQDDGKTIILNQDFLGIPIQSRGTIVESTDSRFVWTVTDEFGDVTETTIEKA